MDKIKKVLKLIEEDQIFAFNKTLVEFAVVFDFGVIMPKLLKYTKHMVDNVNEDTFKNFGAISSCLINLTRVEQASKYREQIEEALQSLDTIRNEVWDLARAKNI